MQLKLMWWNAGLSPGRGGPASKLKRKAAYSLITGLIEQCGFDVIGICEVSPDDVHELEKLLGRCGFGIIAAQDKVGKLQFDMCLIYRIEKISCRNIDDSILVDTSESGNMKVAYIIEGGLDNEKILFALSHWPSRINKHDGHVSRDRLGDSLRDFIKKKLEEGARHIAFMGDYNDEPYSKPINMKLKAVRDVSLVSADENWLYNPFWRHLGGNPAYQRGQDPLTPPGTHYYKSSNFPWQQWWLFDQMIFSRSFVCDGPWHLNEESTGILFVNRKISDWLIESSEDRPKAQSSDNYFDHLPIFATLQRVI